MYDQQSLVSVKLLTEHHLEFLRLKGGCTGSPESTLVKIPHCWKSNVAAHLTETTAQVFTWTGAHQKLQAGICAHRGLRPACAYAQPDQSLQDISSGRKHRL